MASTPRFGLSRIQAGDSFGADGFKFSDADRLTIENLIYSALQHHHTGAVTEVPATDTAPDVDLDSTFGAVPGNHRVFYKMTWVDVSGNETVATPEAYVDTPSTIAVPGTPVLAVNSTGGTLTPGNYYYVLSAYKTANSAETQAQSPAFITVPIGTSTNRLTVGFPTLPTGADGFNVYRRGPGEVQYSFLASVAVSGGSPTSYTDTGSVTPNAARSVPSGNTTNSTNNITVTVPATTVDNVSYPAGTVPVGYTWKLYRSYVSGEYTNTLLHHVVEETSPGSGVVLGYYVDTGGGTQQGTPPTTTQFVDSPPQVDLVDHVTNTLPLGRAAYPFTITFDVTGTVGTGTGTIRWVNEYQNMSIVGCRAAVGRGFAPSGSDVIVDVLKGTGTNPSPTTIYTTTGNRPTVVVGDEVGERTVPDITILGPGDSLTVDVVQDDSGLNAADLSVNVYAVAFGFPGIAFVPGTSTGVVPTGSDTGRGTDDGVRS